MPPQKPKDEEQNPNSEPPEITDPPNSEPEPAEAPPVEEPLVSTSENPPGRALFEGPVIARNIHEYGRSWPDLTTLSGHTLSLKPGEEDTLAKDPGDVSYLQIRPTGGN